MQRLLAVPTLALPVAACDDDRGCPELERDGVDFCAGWMTGAVFRDGEWRCPDDGAPCADPYPGEVCLVDRIASDPSPGALAACPDVLRRTCADWSGVRGACACACDDTTGQVRSSAASAGR